MMAPRRYLREGSRRSRSWVSLVSSVGLVYEHRVKLSICLAMMGTRREMEPEGKKRKRKRKGKKRRRKKIPNKLGLFPSNPEELLINSIIAQRGPRVTTTLSPSNLSFPLSCPFCVGIKIR